MECKRKGRAGVRLYYMHDEEILGKREGEPIQPKELGCATCEKRDLRHLGNWQGRRWVGRHELVRRRGDGGGCDMGMAITREKKLELGCCERERAGCREEEGVGEESGDEGFWLMMDIGDEDECL
ncbi:unnamed protein product [Dovyalis caffra]|uniref:Uncharacterized protein n=1 Tax=Dovyalis caffra TaxID=77055 RepID=A0AAV1RJ53_9ROSI|nr:unnamed protein product [Dovyalis caffra]